MHVKLVGIEPRASSLKPLHRAQHNKNRVSFHFKWYRTGVFRKKRVMVFNVNFKYEDHLQPKTVL